MSQRAGEARFEAAKAREDYDVAEKLKPVLAKMQALEKAKATAAAAQDFAAAKRAKAEIAAWGARGATSAAAPPSSKSRRKRRRKTRSGSFGAPRCRRRRGK